MIKWIIGILIFSNGLSLVAQSRDIDSLNSLLLDTSIEESEQLGIRYALTEASYHVNKDSALYHIEQGLKLIRIGVDHPELNDLDFLYFKLNIKHRTDKYDEAEKVIEEIDRNIDRAVNKPRLLFNNYRARASIAFARDNDFDLVKVNLDKALEIAEDAQDSELIWAAYTEHASLYSKQGDRTDLVAYYLIQASKHIQHDKPNLIINYINIGNLNFHFGKDSTALFYLDEVLKLKEHSTIPLVPPNAAFLAANIYMAKKNWSAAEEYMEQSARLAEEASQDQAYHLAMVNLAKIKFELNEDQSLEQSMLEAYRYFKENEIANHLATASGYLAQFYYESDKNKAIGFYNQLKAKTDFDLFQNRDYVNHISLIDDLATLFEDYKFGLEVKRRYLAYLENKIQSEQNLKILQYKKEYELELEAKTIEMEVENLKSEKRRLVLFSSALGGTLILGFSLILLFMNLRKQRANNSILASRSSALIRSNDKLENKNKELERLAYITSHDLKTPLLSITQFSRMIKEELQEINRPDLTEFASFINDSSRQMDKLIVSVLEYSKLIVKNRTDDTEDVNLKDVVGVVRIALKSINADKTTQIIYEGDLVTIKANKSALISLFQNLIGNGLHYNNSETPTVTVKIQANDENVTILFVDNGIGIPSDKQGGIFTMFSRLHNNSQYSGTGIGLAIVQKIVDDLNGSVTLNSSDKGGSTFKVLIPTDVAVRQELKLVS